MLYNSSKLKKTGWLFEKAFRLLRIDSKNRYVAFLYAPGYLKELIPYSKKQSLITKYFGFYNEKKKPFSRKAALPASVTVLPPWKDLTRTYWSYNNL